MNRMLCLDPMVEMVPLGAVRRPTGRVGLNSHGLIRGAGAQPLEARLSAQQFTSEPTNDHGRSRGPADGRPSTDQDLVRASCPSASPVPHSQGGWLAGTGLRVGGWTLNSLGLHHGPDSSTEGSLPPDQLESHGMSRQPGSELSTEGSPGGTSPGGRRPGRARPGPELGRHRLGGCPGLSAPWGTLGYRVGRLLGRGSGPPRRLHRLAAGLPAPHRSGRSGRVPALGRGRWPARRFAHCGSTVRRSGRRLRGRAVSSFGGTSR